MGNLTVFILFIFLILISKLSFDVNQLALKNLHISKEILVQKEIM
jgi:hypothetical protein